MADVLAGQGAGRLPDTGEYLSGNPLSKIIDLLSTFNYAAAGGVGAALQGQDVLQGAGEGIRGRKSFIDVLEEQGAPGVAAIPLGLAADFLTPTLPGAGLLRLGRGKHLARLGGVVQRMGTAERSLDDVAKMSDTAQDLSRTAEDVLRTSAGSRAARGTFHATGGDVVAAREAAVVERTGIDAPSRGMRSVLEGNGPESPSLAPAWLRGVQAVNDRLIRTAGGFIESNAIFGDTGKKFVQAARRTLNIGRGFRGELKYKIDGIIKLVGKDHEEFFNAVHGLKAASKPEVQKAAELFRTLDNEVFRFLTARGTRQVMKAETILFRRLSSSGKQEVQRLMKIIDSVAQDGDTLKGTNFERLADGRALPTDHADMLRATAEGRYALLFAGKGITIDEGGKAVANLKYLENHAPLLYKERVKREVVQRDIGDLMQMLRDAEPDLSPGQARMQAEKILMDRMHEPGDIRKQLQHQRATPTIIESKDFELDPRKYLYKYAGDTSDLMANVHVWGGDNGLWHGLRTELAHLHGFSEIPDAAAGQMAGTAYGEAAETMEKAFSILQGTHRDRATPVLKALDRTSDFMYLGPRTVLLQPSTLTNSGALMGVGNSFMGIAEALTDAPARKWVERLGSHIPTMLDAVDDQRGLQKIQFWNPIMNMIGKTDRGMRVTAAMGGGIHVAETEERILDAVRAGNRMKAEKMAGFLHRTYGIDTAGLLRGEPLADDMFGRAMQQAAHVTNFTGDVMALPKAFQGPAGKFFLKFKQYSIQQSHFINRLVTEAYVHDNKGPLLRYIAMFPWVYHHILRATNALKTEERQVDPHEAPLEYMKNLMMIGALGYMGDAAMALSSDSEALGLGLFAGPNASMTLKMKQGVLELLPWHNEGTDFEKAGQHLLPQWARQGKNLWQNSQ